MALGLVPLVALALLRARGHRRDAAWWWMAVAFAVSFVADAVTLVAPHRYVAQVYPFLQAGILLAVLLPRRWVEVAGALLLAAAAVSITGRSGGGHDVLLRTVAFGMVAAVAWVRVPRGTLRTALVVGFGGGAVAWWGYVVAPGWVSWSALQAVRLVAVVGFAKAAGEAADAAE